MEKIFIWGMMGSGKTLLGQRLADQLGLAYFDLDYEIEKESGLSIPEFFERFGESKFREFETGVLNAIAKRPHSFLMSCGGGTPCFDQNGKLMNELGKTIFLEVPIPILVIRLMKDESNRPLLSDLSVDEITTTLEELTEERKPFYSAAQFKVSIAEDLEESIQSILKLIQTNES